MIEIKFWLASVHIFNQNKNIMHNIPNDHFQQEFNSVEDEFEFDPEFEFEQEYDEENEFEFELDQDYASDEMEFEVFEMELAEELLELESEAEFFDWAKKVAKRTAGVAADLLSSSAGRKAVRSLGRIAKRTLPAWGGSAGRAIGSAIGRRVYGKAGARTGAAWGRRAGAFLGGKAGKVIANRLPGFVRLTADTFRNLSKELNSGMSMEINPAIIKAASNHYPIILRARGSSSGNEYEFEEEFENEFENEYEFENEFEFEGEVDSETGLTEAMEMELAGELLNINSDQELDMFLGKLFKKAARGVRRFARSSTGRALGGMLKKVAKRALPIAGGAIGNFLVPGVGGMVGRKLGSFAGNLFELELEGLSPEDQEFEMARAYVRFASNAAKNAVKMPPNGGRASASSAFKHAARTFAPGLLGVRGGSLPSSSKRKSGRWYRKGGNIILQGI